MSKARKHFNEFAKLRAESEKIGTQLDMPPLPIKRSIEQVAETSRRLAAKTTGAEQIAAKNKGKYLLAKKVDVMELDRLKDIEIKTAFAPQEPLKEDIEGFLSHHNDIIILSAIEDAKRETENRYKSNFVSCLKNDWEETMKSILATIGGPQFATSTKEFDPRKVSEYARLISEYARRKDIPLLDYMIRISQSIDPRNTALNNCWSLLKCLLDSPTTSRRTLVERSKLFLEFQFREYIKKMVRQHPQMAELGGEPSLLNQIQAYIRILNVQGSLIWPQVYYLIRCGDTEEAERLAARNNIDLSKQRDLRPTNDPYHDAVVSIRNHGVSTPKVVRAWEDFMWFKLKTLPQNDSTLDEELQKIQQLFDQAPPAHYNKGKNPLAFLQILLLSQQFSRAIQYFSETHYKVEAIHFAIALYLADLLPVPAGSSDPSSEQMFTKDGINFDKIIQFYAPKTPDPLSYYFILREKAPEKFISSLKKYVLETKEYSFLKDDRVEDDLRKHFQEIAQQAAASLEEMGMDEDAFDLYLLARRYTRVLVILNRQLGKVLSMTGQSAERDQWLVAANKFQKEVDPAALALLERDREFRIYEKLRKLQQFFDLVFKSDWESAYEVLKTIDIVPKSSAEVAEKLQNYKTLEKPSGDSIRNNIEAILSANMDVLVNVSRMWRSHPDINERKLQYNLEWAKALIKFSASLPGGVARDLNPKLVWSMRELETRSTGFFGRS